jgi:hypothetical protein
MLRYIARGQAHRSGSRFVFSRSPLVFAAPRVPSPLPLPTATFTLARPDGPRDPPNFSARFTRGARPSSATNYLPNSRPCDSLGQNHPSVWVPARGPQLGFPGRVFPSSGSTLVFARSGLVFAGSRLMFSRLRLVLVPSGLCSPNPCSCFRGRHARHPVTTASMALTFGAVLHAPDG